jgi:uncharacterized membrane protein
MKAMDQTDFIKELEQKLKLLKEEKIMYQNLAQDKTNFIEQLTNDENQLKSFNEASHLYDQVRELMERTEEEKHSRI